MTDMELSKLLLLSEQLCNAVRKYKTISKISLDIFYGDSENDLINAIDGYYTYPRTYSSHLLWLVNSSIYIFKRVNGDMLRMLDELRACIPLYMNTFKREEFKEFKKRWNNVVCKIKPLLSTRETTNPEILAIKQVFLNLPLIKTPQCTKQHHFYGKEVHSRDVKLRHTISSNLHQEGDMMETGDITSKTMFFKLHGRNESRWSDGCDEKWWSFESEDELLVFLKSSIGDLKYKDLSFIHRAREFAPTIDTTLSIKNICVGYNLNLPHAKGTHCLEYTGGNAMWGLLQVVENLPLNHDSHPFPRLLKNNFNCFIFPYVGITMLQYLLCIYKKIDELLDTSFKVGTPKRASCDCGVHTYFICKEGGGGIECMNCNKLLCTICNLEHTPGHTCPGNLDLVEYRQNGGMVCPTCFIPTDRDGGCFHITCRSCDTHWCWLCGDRYPPGVPRDAHHNGNYYGISCKTLDARNGIARQEMTPVEHVIAMGIPAAEVEAGLELERRRLENAQRHPFNPNI